MKPEEIALAIAVLGSIALGLVLSGWRPKAAPVNTLTFREQSMADYFREQTELFK